MPKKKKIVAGKKVGFDKGIRSGLTQAMFNESLKLAASKKAKAAKKKK